MKHLTHLILAAVGAAILASVIVYAGSHVPRHGLHEDIGPHPGGLATLFFYWWGGIMAVISPLIYLWLWRKAREYGREGQEPF